MDFGRRALLAATIVVLLPVCYALGSTDLSGKWVLDLHASSSSDPMLKRLGVPWIERKLAASIKLESTYTQSPSLLTIHTHGPAFSRTELIRLDNKPETKTEALTGDYTRFAFGGLLTAPNSSQRFLFALKAGTMPS